jgi:chromosome transmission fidelity protein 1
MEERISSCDLPEEFPFPYTKPYYIQLNFMRALYKTLELKKIGIFESPTGTVRPFSFKTVSTS